MTAKDSKKTISIPIQSDEDVEAKETMAKPDNEDAFSEEDVLRDAEVAAEALAEAAAAAEAEKPEVEDPVGHLQRLQAEFDNYRKRTVRERGETVARAQAQVVEQLLPALDDLERALESIADKDSPLAQGFVLVGEKLHKTLQSLGVEKIDSVGEVFDPNFHEALLTEPVAPEHVGKVIDELVVGYRLKDRVIRPARVKVGMETPGDA